MSGEMETNPGSDVDVERIYEHLFVQVKSGISLQKPASKR